MNRTVCTATATRAGSMPIMLSAPYLPQLFAFQMPTVGMPPYLISPYTSFMHSPNHPLAGHIKPQSHLLPVITQASSFKVWLLVGSHQVYHTVGASTGHFVNQKIRPLCVKHTAISWHNSLRHNSRICR